MTLRWVRAAGGPTPAEVSMQGDYAMVDPTVGP
jgi:hypothetical protein